jgi:hypothetical protein
LATEQTGDENKVSQPELPLIEHLSCNQRFSVQFLFIVSFGAIQGTLIEGEGSAQLTS